jgi:membrane-bound lytic murein transglycosylase D
MAKRILLVIIIPIIFLCLLHLLSFTKVVTRHNPLDIVTDAPICGVRAFPVTDQMIFAGEMVPTNNFDIRERFDRELLVNVYWQSQTLLFFKRANRWFPIIEPILKEEGIPDDFKYLALIESGLLNVVSPAGAAGFWQILQSTGRELGLEVTTDVDERYHLEKSTRAAARFLRDAHRLYNSWTSAAASYNMGRAGLNRQITSQKTPGYFDLWLNEETSRYVFRIMAIKAIFENPQGYGFYLQPDDLYPPLDYYTVSVDTTITDLVAFAHHHQVTYKELRTLNPWLRTRELNNRSRKVYEIKITKESLFGVDYQVQMTIPDEIPENPERETDL